MNLLFTRFPLESHFGGAEVQTLSLMKGLAGRGHKVSFLGSCPTLLERVKDAEVKSKELQIGSPPVTKWHAISFLWRRVKMRKQLIGAVEKSGKIDSIIMLSLTEKLLLTEWCHEHGIKVIWVEHDRVGRWLTKNPWLPRLRKLSRLATTVVVSSLSTDLYRAMGWGGEIAAIPNGIDLTKFDSSPRSGPSFPLRIGCIARLTYDKGVDVLIKALKDLPDIHLTIIGSGREEAALKQLLRMNLKPETFNLQPSISDTAEFYRTIDLLILPSRDHDPFGLVVAEAMASGVPTICTDACGIASYLDPSESIIVPAGNAQKLRDAILQIQQHDAWAHLASHGANIAKNRFSLSTMVERYEALLY